MSNNQPVAPMGNNRIGMKQPMKKRDFRCDDDTWNLLVNFVEGESIGAMLRHIIRDFFKGMDSTK